MEILDEFDNEYPLRISFCKLISLEDFEEQSLSYTRQCLHELYLNMEQNPRICERALRKQKQMEKEEAGLISYLKAKIFQALQGELNYSNYMGIAEMKEKVLQLRQDMQRANNYAYAAKTGKGQHPRGKKHTLEGRLSCLHSKVPEPPKFTMPRVFGPFPEVVNKQVGRATTSSPGLKYWWTGLTTASQKRLLGNAPTPSQNAGSTGSKPAASVFNTPMSCKFQGDAEDDTDSEKPSPSSSSKEA
ncbi:uncharacterized protein LOC142604278 [Balearica regulorum gibbericeps]|uniref:uncharacterized protein LOC142604278 n=1 Tax=Balearica regulorum gibbericeps TaxID=100784 RepID=UPI003F5E9344